VTPQSEFLVLAPMAPAQVAPLRALLATMNRLPGHADPANALVPFGDFLTIHVARFVILVDETLQDSEAWGISFPDAPIYLAFTGDCDGEAEILLRDLANRAGAGLRQIFAHCEDFADGTDILSWMKARLVKPQAWYINWVGRTVKQVHEEAALRQALREELTRAHAEGERSPAALHQRLRTYVRDTNLPLTPPEPTPAGWWWRDKLDLLRGLVILAVCVPLAVLFSPILIAVLRMHEARDPELTTPYDPDRQAWISTTEDFEVTNPFSAMGSVKPGMFRATLVAAVLWLLDFASRHIYTRGRLARVGTIHFARWIMIDGGRRVFFVSNYDGSLESYMDDFINKAGFGLNLVFANGVGYPTTSYLLGKGAWREQLFKAYLRRRQQFTDVWYKAYPALTAFDLGRNSEIRAGIEQAEMKDYELRAWLAKI
jgi:hypothetical protein